MRVSTFQAATLDDAMGKVRAALGASAVVLSWRHVRGGVELTASAPETAAPSPALRAASPSRRPAAIDPSVDDPFGAAARRPRDHEATGPEWDAVFERVSGLRQASFSAVWLPAGGDVG